MSAATTLLKELNDRDIHILLNENKLQIDAPKGVLTSELLDRIRRLKPAPLEELHHIHIHYSANHRHDRHSRHMAIPTLSLAAWDPKTCALIEWFINEGQYRLPNEPFRISPWMHVTNPSLFRDALLFTISLGPEGARLRHGTLTADLQRLKELVAKDPPLSGGEKP